MTAAERQRKCRAGGKGRHRGGITRAMREVELQRAREAAAAAQALREAQPAAQADVQPAAPQDVQPDMQPNASSIAA
jgi:hypothetical protein